MWCVNYFRRHPPLWNLREFCPVTGKNQARSDINIRQLSCHGAKGDMAWHSNGQSPLSASVFQLVNIGKTLILKP